MRIILIHGQNNGYGAFKTSYSFKKYVTQNFDTSVHLYSYNSNKNWLGKFNWIWRIYKKNSNCKFVLVQPEIIFWGLVVAFMTVRISSTVAYLRNELKEIDEMSFFKGVIFKLIFFFANKRVKFITNVLYEDRWYCSPIFIMNFQYLLSDWKIMKSTSSLIYHIRDDKQKNFTGFLELLGSNIFDQIEKIHVIGMPIKELQYDMYAKLDIHKKHLGKQLIIHGEVKVDTQFTKAGVISTSHYEGMPNLMVEASIEGNPAIYVGESDNIKLWTAFLGGVTLHSAQFDKKYLEKRQSYDGIETLKAVSISNFCQIFFNAS